VFAGLSANSAEANPIRCLTDSSPSATAASETNGGNAAGQSDTQGVHESPLTGAWNSACINATSYSARNEVRFFADRMHWRGLSFTSTNCANQDFAFEMHSRYALGLQAGEHFGLDYVLERILFVFTTEDGVRQANDYVYCGIKNWRLNELRDVTGKDCGGTVYRSGDATYDLVRIDQGCKLYFGAFIDGRDGKTPETRPVTIDPHLAYLKGAARPRP